MNKKILSLLLFLFLSGCFRFVTPPPPPCPIGSLLIETSVLPGDEWIELGSRTARGAPMRMGIERIGTSFTTQTQGVATHDVYRLLNQEQAGKGYQETIDTWFSDVSMRKEWSVPTELGDLAVGAEEYELGCGYKSSSSVERCRYIAQYGPYVVKFSADMLGLSYDDFAHVILDIDERMTSCLSQ